MSTRTRNKGVKASVCVRQPRGERAGRAAAGDGPLRRSGRPRFGRRGAGAGVGSWAAAAADPGSRPAASRPARLAAAVAGVQDGASGSPASIPAGFGAVRGLAAVAGAGGA